MLLKNLSYLLLKAYSLKVILFKATYNYANHLLQRSLDREVDCDVIAGRDVQGVRPEGAERAHRDRGPGTLPVRHLSHIRQQREGLIFKFIYY